MAGWLLIGCMVVAIAACIVFIFWLAASLCGGRFDRKPTCGGAYRSPNGTGFLSVKEIIESNIGHQRRWRIEVVGDIDCSPAAIMDSCVTFGFVPKLCEPWVRKDGSTDPSVTLREYTLTPCVEDRFYEVRAIYG